MNLHSFLCFGRLGKQVSEPDDGLLAVFQLHFRGEWNL